MSVLLALAVVVVNVGVSRWLAGRARPAAPGKAIWMEGAGFLFRLLVLFGATQWVWVRTRQAGQVVLVIMFVALGQMIGQVYFILRRGALQA